MQIIASFFCAAAFAVIVQFKTDHPAVAYETPPKRAHHFLAYDENSEGIVLTSGSTPQTGSKSIIFYDDQWAFDGNGWTPVAVTGDRRSGMSIVYDSKEKQLLSMYGFSPANQPLSDLRKLDGLEWKNIK